MTSVTKLSTLKDNEDTLRKEAKKIARKRNKETFKRPTHLFMHEKCLTSIVSFFRCISK